VPGNYAFNLRRMYLLNTNYADLSFLFTILPGEKVNAYLDAEYLAVMETDNQTPYYLNLHCGEVGHALILGMTGSGKSFFAVFVIQNAQKYTPQTYIFDIGGGYECVTAVFGGTYLNVGRESRNFTINPFSLDPTPETCNSCSAFPRPHRRPGRALPDGLQGGAETVERHRTDVRAGAGSAHYLESCQHRG